jgi:hypothetical protein
LTLADSSTIPETHASIHATHDRNVWLHVHVPKAGGSTLRQLMNRSFGRGYYNSTSLLESRQYTSDEVREIIRCHPHVTCMSDHKLSLDLPYDTEHARLYAICYVRDPVERFISRYFFHRHYEEVACIAQRMSFEEFVQAELIERYAHPQTNSQIYFLNGGRSFTDLEVIHQALATGRVFLFPIERFDESCIFLEREFEQFFQDLTYVRANVSKKDAEISEHDRVQVYELLKADYALFDLANQQMDAALERAFPDIEDREQTLADFLERCSRRFHNFEPPRPKESEVAGESSEPGSSEDESKPHASNAASPAEPAPAETETTNESRDVKNAAPAAAEEMATQSDHANSESLGPEVADSSMKSASQLDVAADQVSSNHAPPGDANDER